MTQNNYQELQDKFKSWNNKSDEDLLREDEYMLMANYLSEIERLKRLEGLKLVRKELAKQIKVSASYLTQVFTGEKPLNFYTIAKIQKALNIRFHVRAHLINEEVKYIAHDIHGAFASGTKVSFNGNDTYSTDDLHLKIKNAQTQGVVEIGY